MHLQPEIEKTKNKRSEFVSKEDINDAMIIEQTPKFSLIIPVYEEEKLIEAQLLRFPAELRRKYNFELIVSDGGSLDKTVEIAKKYADKVVVHDNSYRQTISEGRNMGAKAAKGELFVFLNADSYPPNSEEFFKTIIDWYDNSKCLAVACYVEAFPEETIFKDKLFYAFHNNYVAFLNSIGMGMGRGECQIIRKGAFNEVNGYNPKIVAGEDFDLYRRIVKIGKIEFSYKLKVLESPRRFRKYGYIRTVMQWTLNSLAVMLFNKSYSKEWEAVR